MVCRSLVLPSLTWAQFHYLFLEKYVPINLKDCKTNEFTELEQGMMTIASCEAKFHAFSISLLS